MRVTGPHTSKYKGDKDAAKKWHNFALKLLGKLEARMRKTNQTRGAWRRTMVDGTRIEVTSIASAARAAPIRIVRVYSPSSSLHEATETYYYYGIETGLLAVSATQGLFETNYFESDYPLHIYVGADVQTYISSSGTVVPELLGNEYLIQSDETSESRTCPHNSAISVTDWPNTFALDSEESYESKLFIAEAYLNTLYGPSNWSASKSSKYTGLLRLAVQAKNGARVTVGGLSPSGALNYKTDGLFRIDYYTYWAIRVTADGCVARKLEADKTCIAYWLDNNLVADADDVDRFEMHVLASLRPATTPAIVELLTAEQLEDVLLDKFPIAYGWKYSRGTYRTEASIVTYRQAVGFEDKYREATLAKIVFTIPENGTDPSAILTIEEENVPFEIDPQYDKLYKPGLSSLEWFIPSGIGRIPRGNNAPIYCWYTADNTETREVVRYTTGITQPESSYKLPQIDTCCCGHIDNTYKDYSHSAYIKSGFRFDNAGIGDLISTCPSTNSRYVDVVIAAGNFVWVADINRNNSHIYLTSRCEGDWNYPHLLARNPLYNAYGNCSGDYADVGWSNFVNKHTLIIPFDDAEACYLATYSEIGTINDRRYPVNTSHQVISRQHASVPSQGYDEYGESVIRVLGGTYDSNRVEYLNVQQTITYNTDSVEAYLVNSHGTFELDNSEPSAWDLNDNTTVQQPSLGFSMATATSYKHGDKAYWRKPTAEYTLGDSYGFDPADSWTGKALRWLGFA